LSEEPEPCSSHSFCNCAVLCRTSECRHPSLPFQACYSWFRCRAVLLPFRSFCGFRRSSQFPFTFPGIVGFWGKTGIFPGFYLCSPM
jgi:hypothetical protein